ncbi:hypothetical protein CEXT_394791 [Caerostris extrusa]|uniref:Uncharacterized protein n=1 Tax=Caerostris extrusa TaxID=172846 RepID=A0AAV4X8K0_CAEEX|nr:hypothetical protein CEXT_394791 [Caerostris extrusa]
MSRQTPLRRLKKVASQNGGLESPNLIPQFIQKSNPTFANLIWLGDNVGETQTESNQSPAIYQKGLCPVRAAFSACVPETTREHLSSPQITSGKISISNGGASGVGGVMRLWVGLCGVRWGVFCLPSLSWGCPDVRYIKHSKCKKKDRLAFVSYSSSLCVVY